MITYCRNCNTEINGKYCSNCGQKSETHKINFLYLWHELQHELTHLDKGILFTVKELFIRPGNTLREYIEGKRVKHFKPVSLVLVLASVYGLLSHYFQINLLSNNYEITGSGEKFNQINNMAVKMSEWLSEHFSVVALLFIPVFSLGTYLAFKSTGYNYFEHFIINTYLTGQRLFLHILVFPLYYFFNGTPDLRTIARITDLTGYVLMAWALMQLFNMLNVNQRIFRTALSFLITFTIQFVIFYEASRYFLNL
jgi:hypothetical protein